MSRRNKSRPAGSGTQQNITTLDAFSNPLFRLGYGSQSPLEATSYPLTRMTGNYALLNSLYRENWVVQNVVGLIVDDMLREWYDLKDTAPGQMKALRRAEQRAGLRQRVATGLKWGRLYGGAAGLILIAGQTDLSQPLDVDSIPPGSFQGLYILDRWQGITPEAELVFERGEVVPACYSISDAAGHTVTRVHHSRIVRFTGRELPDLERQAELYWGESEVEALYKDVVAHDNVSANMAALTFQANINTMEVKGLEQLLSMSSPDVQRRFWNTMQAQSVLRSNFGMQLVEQGNKISNTQYTFSGLQEVYESMCLNLCGASHYPMTKLFGRSPAGMNATGESDLKNYYDYVDTLRESKLRPVLDKLLPILARSAGVVLDDHEVSFPPLWTPTASETAGIAKTKSESIVSAFQAGLLDVPTALQELRGLSDETGMFGSITDEAIAANTGKTYQDVTALRDPLAGLTGGTENPFDASAVESTPTADYSPSQPRDEHGRWTDGFGTDVTQEYLDNAKPGTGTVSYDEGYDTVRHSAEIKTAQWLHDNLGGDITLLNESDVEGEKRSDYLWHSTFWDLKTSSSEKSANSAIRHGLQQIRENPGGIILDFGNNNFNSENLWSVIDKRMSWNHTEGNVDIMILSKGSLHAVKRYNKK